MLNTLRCLFAFFLTLAVAAASAAPPVRTAVGTNLSGLDYWSPQLPFLDVMKSSSDWIPGDASNWDNGQSLDKDANGWIRSLAPGQVARKLMLREIGNRYPAGQYTVRYKGQGRLSFGFAARVVWQGPGEMLLEVAPSSDGVYMVIEATNPGDYLREIEVIMPGGICANDPFTTVASARDCGATAFYSFPDQHRSIVFNPAFANRLRSYSVLRFMDWMRTNNSNVRRWTDRTPVAFHTWTGPGGAPIEIMVALANLVQAHPWFTVPHQADDDYVRKFARLVAARLNSGLGVYVEHSNEVWNSQFRQYAYALERGRAQKPPIDNMQYHALRTRDIGRLFKGSLAESRVTVVLGAQAANAWTATQGLEYLKARYGSTGTINAVATAPYFGITVTPAEAPTYERMTLDELFAAAASQVAWAGWTASEYRAKVAALYGIRLLAYEGGQHMAGIWGVENNATLNALFDAFNRDPRAKGLYLDYLASWRANGGELFVHFNDVSRFDKWGRWGALEYVAQPRHEAPKFDGIQTFIEQNPVWWPQ
jgi:hypothetical protein